MKAVKSSADIPERINPDMTNRDYPDIIQIENLKFPPVEILSERNREGASQTNVSLIDGSSSAICINLREFKLSTPLLPEARDFFQAMQKWEGRVIKVNEDTFTARLTTIKGEGNYQDAEIYIQEVTPDDRDNIEPGAVFYWSIGYLDTPSGRLRTSIIRFRRLPVWTRYELENATIKADNIRDLLDED